ncbi:kelch-like protein 17 [Lytechinus variegatus]|uniref:kelch-like protein 17 n=1 Tax=Lytechinus variegatus TaxID=7654 RepID=UPI001BB29050|nr:kelch-like protein 17 [Lytechinus variegatus]
MKRRRNRTMELGPLQVNTSGTTRGGVSCGGSSAGVQRPSSALGLMTSPSPLSPSAPSQCLSPTSSGSSGSSSSGGQSSGVYIIHHAQRHTNDSFLAMDKMRQQGALCDIVLKVADNEIRAHRLVLASCSAYFHAMFTSDMSESHRSEVTLHEIDPDAVNQLVSFAYTAEIMIGESNVQALLPAASLLQMESVRDACCKFLVGQLDPTNCLGIRRFADTHGCYDLEQSSRQYALYNFCHVVNTEEFLQLPQQEVEQMVSSEQLNVTSEEEVFSAVIQWLQFNEEERKDSVSQLLRCVRLPLLNRDFLVTQVEAHPIVQQCNGCKDLLIEAMKYHLLPEQRSTLQSPRTRLRQNPSQVPVLFAVGGGSLFAIHNECECYDPLLNSWRPMPTMNARRARLGAAAIGKIIYAIGGYDGSHDLASVECFNTQTHSWFELAPLGTKRSSLGVAVLNGLIYAVGGYDGASCLNSAERYDPLTNSWTSITPMSARRRYVKVAALGGCLYAVGGYDGSTHLSSIEKYDPRTNTWTSIPNMINRRVSMGVAVIANQLFVVGGSDGAMCLSSAESFNPEINLWEPLPSMSIRRSTHDAIALDGQLYVVGGNDGSSSLNSAERYDPKTHRWTTISGMSTRRSSVGVTVADIVASRASHNSVAEQQL